MPTNQEIWGESNNWTCPVSGMSGSNNDMKPLVGYFGEAPSANYATGCLYSGIYHDIFPTINGNMFTDEPIDNSISYCGLGNESVWSRVQYYMCGPNTTGSLTASDNRSVTNFAFCDSQGSMSGLYQNNDSDANQRRGNRDRWSPMGYNLKELNPTPANTNSNRRVQPYVQLPVRNMVLTATIRCARQLVEDRASTSGMDLANVALWDYMDTTKTRNYTTHPYILGISIQPYMVGTNAADNIDPVTGVPTSDRTSLNIYSGITLLSPLSYANGVESDAGNPGNILNDVYSYYWSRTPARLTGIWIFGSSSVGLNDNEYIRQLSTDNVTGQLRWALPHPYAVMRSMTGTNDYGWYYLEYYDNGEDDNLVHWIMEQMACFGLFFTIDKATATRGALNNENMCLGVLEDGIGHGHWVSGEENEEQEQWEWDTTNSSSYKPHDGSGGGDDPYGDANHYLDAHAYARGGKVYGTDDAGKWINLLNDINGIDIHADGFNDSVFFGQEPIECLIEGKLVFVNGLLGAVNASPNTNIELGQHQTSVTATRIRATYPYTADYGSIYINGVYNDFRDFEPYTSINLLLPFAGSVELPPSVAMYHSVHLYETIDLLTGDLFYTIHIDNIEFGRAYGNCALELSKNGYAVSQYAQMRYSLHEQSRRSYFNAAASLLGGMSGTGIAASYGNVAGVVTQSLGGLANAANSFIDGYKTGMFNRHTAPPVASSDKVSACVEYGRCIIPAIVVTSPRMVEGYADANYKSQTGFATYKVGRIGNESGPIMCDSVNPSGLTCSAEEKRMIIEHLKRGIYRKSE